MINNTSLYDSLKRTTEISFQFYKENVQLDEKYKNDSLHVFINLSKFDTEIEKLDSFTTSMKIMDSDETINSLIGKRVGAFSHNSLYESSKTSIHSFLIGLYLLNKEYTNSEFDTHYQNFEDFFYLDYFIIKDSTKIYNLTYSGKKINLGNGVSISESTTKETERRFGEMSYSHFSKSKFVIEKTYKSRKINFDSLESTEWVKLVNKESANIQFAFDSVIISLRILKNSAVYRDSKIMSQSITYSPRGGTLTTSPYFENIVIGEKCELLDLEIYEFTSIYNYIQIENDSRFGVATRRLTSGMERRNSEDRLIDYMIGLETLFLPDGNAELSFRLSLRVAFLLFNNQTERKMTFEFLRNMYDVRSKIVHGKQYVLTPTDVLQIENLLRNAIKLWISDKKSFLHKITISNKTEDGKLNSVFFE